ncbi:hypothetical protein B0H34DRAFT_399733 [Crassisporium funariophilum]|nr:hypothetical protein B0H34DRAFT_399733 [Crassisporium funariophilum]
MALESCASQDWEREKLLVHCAAIVGRSVSEIRGARYASLSVHSDCIPLSFSNNIINALNALPSTHPSLILNKYHLQHLALLPLKQHNPSPHLSLPTSVYPPLHAPAQNGAVPDQMQVLPTGSMTVVWYVGSKSCWVGEASTAVVKRAKMRASFIVLVAIILRRVRGEQLGCVYLGNCYTFAMTFTGFWLGKLDVVVVFLYSKDGRLIFTWIAGKISEHWRHIPEAFCISLGGGSMVHGRYFRAGA